MSSTPIELARSAAREAGQILMNLLGNSAIHQKESTFNLVTDADVAAEEAIVAHIRDSFPDHSIMREEGESTGTELAEKIWIIDPLDGTNNFAHGIPQFAVSIAYAENGVVHAGVVYDPNRDELFEAEKGFGAKLNGNSITVSTRPTIQQSVVATGFYYDRGELMTRTLASINRLFANEVRGMRRFGSAALDLCWVACGRFDGYFEYQLAPWDYCAGWLLVTEAGGRCSNRYAEPLRIDSRSMIASNALTHQDLIDKVMWTT